ncbi:hypothetical protein CBR_g29740 [Chara braunii]|uniref:heme oxygenase (biliverdin-producing) n=1 Tax=Chara braunii TaxID=69332 RepID=A0A388LBN5_CHABU|nr:hypothetical protein CBR_g29740 [Chara braunii]|eukprot:GBG79593.1 hypothetical protein CBR_g29740 [Chara braunii]
MANVSGEVRSHHPLPLTAEENLSRVRASVGRCYDEGICPDDTSLGEVVEDEQGKRFVVSGLVNEVKNQWLKERSVIVVFQGEARSLARSVKEDLIRAYEDGWTARCLFHPEARRGRVKFEGPNVVSYVAKAKEIADWLLQQGELKIKLGLKEYQVLFKPRLTERELQIVRILEAETKFWIMALRVPLDAYYYMRSAVKGMFGDIVEVHNPEYDRDRPKLMNVKFDMPPESRSRIDDELVIQSPTGECWKVEIVSPYTDWCKRCRWHYHTADNCPRRQKDEGRGNNGERQGGHCARYCEFQHSRERRSSEDAGNGGEEIRGQRGSSRVMIGQDRTRSQRESYAQPSTDRTEQNRWRHELRASELAAGAGEPRRGASVLDSEADMWGRWAWLKVEIAGEEWVFMTITPQQNAHGQWEQTRQYFESTADWLDGGLATTSGALDVISRSLARERNKKEADCKRRVEEAEENMEGNPISAMVWAAERERRLSEWNAIQEEKQKRWTDILKVKGIETNDKMTKETFHKLQPRRTQQQMVELRHPVDAAAPTACAASGMLQYARLYYSDILTSRRPQEDVYMDLANVSDMWEDTTVKLQIIARLDLDRPISLAEVTQTIKSMAVGKSPGVDGLTVEFYRANWAVYGPLLVELYNEILVGGRLGRGMTRGVIMVLFKKGDKADIRNWHPISLLNLSYKILAKTLARRLSKYFPELVGRDQGAFVQGHSIFNNIVTAIETLEVVQEENLDVAVLLLDLEKAYDKVGWTFTFTTLKQMGFGEGFCSWFVALYTVSTSAMMVNGHLSEPFPLTRWLRQGCPLGPLVFVLQLEVLLNRIRKHPDIRGLQLHTGEECKVKALADDVFAVCENTEKSLIALKSVMREYCTLSEATVNWNKSTYLLPAQFNLQVEWGMRRVESGEEERFLGVLVSMQIGTLSQGLLLQQRISARLRLWGHTWHLSLIGRALVANVALLSILWFVTTVKEMAEGVIRVIKKLVARFIWKPRALASEGFLSKVAYDTLSFPRVQGGLGLLDPGRRNQAQLQDWVAKVANAKARDHWFDLAERILMREWDLSRPQDVWDCFFIPSFRKRRLKSGFWEPIRRAWHRTPPDVQSPPATRDEVLKQLLFENPAVVNQAGQAFAADSSTGTFGQAWIKKGVVRISDLWSITLGGRKPLAEVKSSLRGLQRTEEHWREIINAIPQEWMEILGPEGMDPAGTWWPFESTRHLWWECLASKRVWNWWKGHWEEMGGQGVEWNEKWVLLGFLQNNVKGHRGWGYIAHVTFLTRTAVAAASASAGGGGGGGCYQQQAFCQSVSGLAVGKHFVSKVALRLACHRLFSSEGAHPARSQRCAQASTIGSVRWRKTIDGGDRVAAEEISSSSGLHRDRDIGGFGRCAGGVARRRRCACLHKVRAQVSDMSPEEATRESSASPSAIEGNDASATNPAAPKNGGVVAEPPMSTRGEGEGEDVAADPPPSSASPSASASSGAAPSSRGDGDASSEAQQKSPWRPGERKGFVEEMRIRAMKLHTRDQAKEGEKESQAKPLAKWQPTVTGYIQFLVDSKALHDTMEAIVADPSKPMYQRFLNTGLERSEALAKDLEWFASQGNEIPAPDAAGTAYADYLRQLAESNPPAFICHFYNVYFAHSAGGRMIGRKVAEMILDGRELEFYKWDGELQELLTNVRTQLNEVAQEWSREEKDVCLTETELSFKYSGEILRLLAS